MNKHIWGCIVVSSFLIASFFLFALPRQNSLHRIILSGKSKTSVEERITDSFFLQKDGSSVSLDINNQKYSFSGILVDSSGAVDEIESIQFGPRKKGRYILEFSLFLKPLAGRELLAFIRQLRDGEVKRVRLGKETDVFRYQIPFLLSKKDVMEFYLKNVDFGLISHPVLYKEKSRKKKEYIFVIAADTFRRDRMGIYNREQKNTPTIDALAQDSVVFTQAYSTSSWTAPAFMSLFTALNPDRHRVNLGNVRLDKEIKTLFEFLNDQFLVYGITGDHFVSSAFGFNRGFDVYTENFADGMSRTASKTLFEQAFEMLDRDKYGKAVFFLHTYQTHNPYNPETELAVQLNGEHLNGDYFNPLRLIQFGRELYKSVPNEEKSEILKIYDAALFTFDYRFGEFIRSLKENGIYEDSTIIFLSDHGEEFMDHGAWEHGHSLYNELIQIPLIVKYPGSRQRGKSVQETVSIVDILPTVLDMQNIRIKSSDEFDGISLLKAGRGKTGRNRIVSSFLASNALRNGIPEKIALVCGSYKYIHNKKMGPDDLDVFLTRPPELGEELFEIFSDPGERFNIIETHPELAAQFSEYFRNLNFKSGKRGFLKELEGRLRSLGYF
jgi:arylsulfatase A-like enzyme